MEEKRPIDQSKRLDELESRLEDIELVYDCSLFSSYMGRLDRDSIYTCIEIGVARYFGLERGEFYDSLIVGNRSGRRGRHLPLNPMEFADKEDRLIVARQCLFAILHIDFHVSIPNLKDYYNVNPAIYINNWRDRYVRIFFGGSKKGKNDDAYRSYWLGCYKSCVEVSIELGLYDKLLEELSKEGLQYNRLVQWRINTDTNGLQQG